jgi:hypothetical protein
MRKALIAGFLAFGLSAAQAGMMNQYQAYMEQYNSAKSALESRKASLKSDQFQRLSTELEAGKKRMDGSVGTMTREAFYELAQREAAGIRQIRSQIGM